MSTESNQRCICLGTEPCPLGVWCQDPSNPQTEAVHEPPVPWSNTLESLSADPQARRQLQGRKAVMIYLMPHGSVVVVAIDDDGEKARPALFLESRDEQAAMKSFHDFVRLFRRDFPRQSIHVVPHGITLSRANGLPRGIQVHASTTTEGTWSGSEGISAI